MNDVFHLSPVAITIDDLVQAAALAGYPHAQLGSDAATILDRGAGRVLWSITPLEMDELSAEEREALAATRILRVHSHQLSCDTDTPATRFRKRVASTVRRLDRVGR